MKILRHLHSDLFRISVSVIYLLMIMSVQRESEAPISDSPSHDARIYLEYLGEQNAHSFGLGPGLENVGDSTQKPKQLRKSISGHSNQSAAHEAETDHTHAEVDKLKKMFGPVLTAALSELCLRRPTDPLEYLGHWLLRYQYNAESKRREVDSAAEAIKEDELATTEKEGNRSTDIDLEPDAEGHGGSEYEGEGSQHSHSRKSMVSRKYEGELYGEYESAEHQEQEPQSEPNTISVLHPPHQNLPGDEDDGSDISEHSIEGASELVEHTSEVEASLHSLQPLK